MMNKHRAELNPPCKVIAQSTNRELTRLDVFAQLPVKVRELIRSSEGNIEDCEIGMKVSRKEYVPAFEKVKNDTEEHIRSLLSLTFTGSELETAFQAIREGRW